MAERKAVNKYYPPDWDPSKGSLNRFVGSHPLRSRARNLGQGILVIRFEMPFNIWCLGCSQHIGRGVRFNAQKKEIGKYYTTPILSFRMKCAMCSNWIEIHTDPKNSEYVVVSGARRKVEEFEAAANESHPVKTAEAAEKLIYNPFFKLEHEVQDQRRAKEMIPKLDSIKKLGESMWKDDFASSSSARKKFRQEREEYKKQLQKADSIRERLDLGDLPLLPESEKDKEIAQMTKFKEKEPVLQGSIFSNRKTGASNSRVDLNYLLSLMDEQRMPKMGPELDFDLSEECTLTHPAFHLDIQQARDDGFSGAFFNPAYLCKDQAADFLGNVSKGNGENFEKTFERLQSLLRRERDKRIAEEAAPQVPRGMNIATMFSEKWSSKTISSILSKTMDAAAENEKPDEFTKDKACSETMLPLEQPRNRAFDMDYKGEMLIIDSVGLHLLDHEIFLELCSVLSIEIARSRIQTEAKILKLYRSVLDRKDKKVALGFPRADKDWSIDHWLGPLKSAKNPAKKTWSSDDDFKLICFVRFYQSKRESLHRALRPWLAEFCGANSIPTRKLEVPESFSLKTFWNVVACEFDGDQTTSGCRNRWLLLNRTGLIM